MADREPNLFVEKGLKPLNPVSVTISLVRRFGGDKRDRTADPLLARQVLSQLSYTPKHAYPYKKTARLGQSSHIPCL